MRAHVDGDFALLVVEVRPHHRVARRHRPDAAFGVRLHQVHLQRDLGGDLVPGGGQDVVPAGGRRGRAGAEAG